MLKDYEIEKPILETCLDFNWGIVLKETNKVIGMIEVFDI